MSMATVIGWDALPTVMSLPANDADLMDSILAGQGYAIAREEEHGLSLPPGAVGYGSFGMVYKARKDGVDYAIKLAENVSAMKDTVESEIRVLSLLDHPSIVQYVEAFCYPPRDWTFIVMEFVQGGTLQAALIRRPETFSEDLLR